MDIFCIIFPLTLHAILSYLFRYTMLCIWFNFVGHKIFPTRGSVTVCEFLVCCSLNFHTVFVLFYGFGFPPPPGRTFDMD